MDEKLDPKNSLPPTRWANTAMQIKRPVVLLSELLSVAVFLIIIISLSVVYGHPKPSPVGSTSSGPPAWTLENFKSLVTFGDSYTDESRSAYFGSHGQAPPAGWEEPISNETAVGGYVWPRYVNWYSGAKSYNYAVGGAACSTKITPRNNIFVGVEEYELPAFLADKAHTNKDGSAFLDIPPDTTIYAIWIGTNDLGVNSFLVDAQAPDQTMMNYVECVYRAFDQLYASGARRFVLMNNVPLDLAPVYALADKGGTAQDSYWPDKPQNLTAISYRMREQVAAVNYAFKYQIPFEIKVSNRYHGAEMVLFDVFGLFNDIYNNPGDYLNGTAPASSTGFVNHCNIYHMDCSRNTSPDSFLWYDELHPSEQASRILAKEFVNVASGKSKYATYWS